MACKYDINDDNDHSFESSMRDTINSNINLFLNELLELSSFDSNDTPIFIDFGDKYGFHGIYASKIGYKTWMKEEDESNLMQVLLNLTYLMWHI